jgi:hypothetical protein
MKYFVVRGAFFVLTFVMGYFAAVSLNKNYSGPTIEESLYERLPPPEREQPTLSAEPTEPRLIVPGKSVGHLRLGASRARAIELFGRKIRNTITTFQQH